MKMKPRLLIILLTCIFGVSKGQLTIVPATTPQAPSVVDTLLSSTGLSGPPTNISYKGGPLSYGTFRGTSNLGIASGILLSTGSVVGVNAAPGGFLSVGTGVTGDPDLQTLTPIGITIQDVSVLEFDFVPKTDTIRFRYAFGSEEYPEWVCCAFTDVFGFFVSGPKPSGGNYVSENVALIPGTSIPVGVGTVNPGTTGANCGGSTNCQSLSYSSYFNTNSGTTIIYDGFTDVFEVVIPVLMCGSYHIKLAIGDAQDQAYDSGVFLEAHSFGGGWVHIYDTLATSAGVDTSILCQGDTVTLIAPNSSSYLWTNGATTQSVQLTTPGNINYVVFNPANGCFNSNYTYHVIGSNPVAVIDTLGSTTLCAGDSVKLFSAATGSAYLWSNGATSASIWVDYSKVGTYTLTVTDQYGKCDSVSSAVTIYPGNGVANITVVGDTILCPGETVTLQANSGLLYNWSNGATSQSITVGTAGTYTVTVDNGGCSASAVKKVYLSTPNATIVPSGATTFCQPGQVTLNAPSGYTSYLWNGGSSSAGLLVNSTGTYTVTVTDSVGCQATGSQAVTVNTASASIVALTDSVLCAGAGDSIHLFGSAGNIYQWSNGATTQNIWATAAGNYSVTITNANGCTATSNQVSVTSSSVNASVTNSSIICFGNNFNIVANGVGNYLWSTGATTSSINVAPAATTPYVVTVTNIYGCTDTAGMTLTVNHPSVSINTPDSSFCSGDSTSFSATAGYSNYNWSTGLNGNYPSIYVNHAASVSVVVTDAAGCTATSSNIQTVVDSATVTVQLSSDPVLCVGEHINLTAQTAASNFAWSNGATTSTISVTNGTYSVTVTNANGCTAASNPVVLTLSNPTAVVTPSVATPILCPGGTLQLTETAGTGVSWNWSTNATTQSITVADSGLYLVTITDAQGCTANASLTVGLDNPAANIAITSGSATFCSGNQAVLSASGTTGTSFAYLWSDGSTTQNIVVTSQNNYTVTVTNNFGCPASDNQFITVNFATASITPTTDSTFCNGDSIQLFNTSPNTSSVLWSNGLTGNSIWVNNNSSYSFVVTDNNGCTAASDTLATTLSYPAASITPQSNPVICPGTTVTLDATNANNATGNTFLWSDGTTGQSVVAAATQTYTVTVTNYLGCVAVSPPVNVIVSIPSASISVADLTLCPGEQASLNANAGSSYLWHPRGEITQQLLTSTGGTYSVDVTDTAGCVATSADVTVENLPAEAVTAVSGATSFCRGGAVTISAVTPGTYVWYPGGSTDSSVIADNTETYTVAVTNLNGCVAVSAPVSVFVHEYPVISFTADSTSECDAFKIRFHNYSTFENNSLITWTFGDSTTSHQYSPIHWYTINGMYNVTLNITSPIGCSSTDSSEINVIRFPDPVADFEIVNNIENVFAGPIAFINKSKNAVRYHWDFGDNSGSQEENPTHDYREPGYYTIELTAFNPANCEHREHKEVTIAPLFIPSAFTPNGDGINDMFPTGLPADLDVKAYELSIFNRWGERVFFSDNPSRGWTGNGTNGKPAPDASYIYEMKITDRLNKDFTFKGNVTIVR
jgi:gliding motility-associated-like protein